MKSNQILTLLFWHRKSKADTNDYAPIVCRISIDSKSEELTTGVKAYVNDWDVDSKKVCSGL